MNNLLIAIAVFIITVVGALIAVPHFIDWNSYRSAFEEEAKNVIGRAVEVDGDMTLHLLPTPYFRVEKVRIADTSTALSEHFFKTESLSIKLSIAPLLRGVVEANEIEFQRPVLRAALDAQGRWNWQGFAQALRSTVYMPANVTLTSVRVVDGVLALHGADGLERTRLDGINGELSAPALDGPYRFRGTFTSGGATREVRIVTASPEPDGKVPVRLSLRLLDSGASYVLNARAIDLMGNARLEGDLTARLPIAGPPPPGLTQRVNAGSDDEPHADWGETPLEVKVAIKADAAGAALSDLTLTFEQGDRPQIVTGAARADWRTPVSVDLDLASRWLDLDRLAGISESAGPTASVGKLAAWVRDLLPANGVTRVALVIEQANLAGETVGPLRLALARSAGRLQIAELRTTLPGGSLVDLKGEVSGAADAVGYNGDIGLKGASAARFAAWASGNSLSIPAEADGPFDLRAKITIEPGQAAIRDLAGTLAGNALKGSGRYQWAGRPELTVALEGARLDARGLIPANLSLIDALALIARPSAAPKDDGGAQEMRWAILKALQSDLDLQLKAGQLVTASRAYRDFGAAVVTRGGHLSQLMLRLAGDDGYKLELEGKVDNLATQPKGTVRGHVTAETPDSVAPLATLLGVPGSLRLGDMRERAMVPLRLAAALTLGGRTPTSADLVVDGESGGATVKVNAHFDGAANGWRNGRADITGAVDASDAARIAGLLFPDSLPPGRAGSAKPGRILIRAAGVPAEGLSTLASVDAGDAGLSFRGRVVIDDTGTRVEGDVQARAGNGTSLATLAGLSPPLRMDGVPVSARAKLTLGEDMLSMDKLMLQLGGTKLGGKIALSRAEGRPRIDATLSADELSVGQLMSPLLDRRFSAASAAEAALGQQSPWPDEPFYAPALDALDGQIRLGVKRLTLADGMALQRAKVHVLLQPGKIEVNDITGSAPGGEVKASVSIAKIPTGASIRGTLGFLIALDQLPGPRPPRASGVVNGRIAFSGQGVSPRAVLSALQGEGSVALGEVRLPVLTPNAVAGAAAAALNAEPGKLVPALRQALTAGRPADGLAARQTTLALDIADGLARSAPLVVDAEAGRASGTTRLDLKALRLDSQWRIEAKAPDDNAPVARPLPPVTVSYRAPLATLGLAELQVDATALEQELAARKIERDMEELERLRRLNEKDPGQTPPEPAVPAVPAQGPPASPGPSIPPFGHEVRPGTPG